MSISSKTASLSLSTRLASDLKGIPESGPNHISLFITNLRLLDLDLRQDWPHITALVFTTRNALQNQKKRIECVEWALYNLFLIWNQKDTQEKLQPFFPPREPLQSLHLRQALYRCLDNVKKDGVLGRDTVLRRTMLDECKGERLEEVLSVFSTAVLKKVVEEASAERGRSLALQLALKNISYTGETATLKALVLAHKASLSSTLRHKAHIKQNYQRLSQLLIDEGEVLSERAASLEIESDDLENVSISAYEIRNLESIVHKNWSGSDILKQNVINGEQPYVNDAFASGLFEDIESSLDQNAENDLTQSRSFSLIDELSAQIEGQKQWLATWCDFIKPTTQRQKPRPTQLERSLSKAIVLNLTFDQHQGLQLSGTRSERTPSYAPSARYKTLAESLANDLAAVVNKPRADTRDDDEIVSPANTQTSVTEQSPATMSPLRDHDSRGFYTNQLDDAARSSLSQDSFPEKASSTAQEYVLMHRPVLEQFDLAPGQGQTSGEAIPTKDASPHEDCNVNATTPPNHDLEALSYNTPIVQRNPERNSSPPSASSEFSPIHRGAFQESPSTIETPHHLSTSSPSLLTADLAAKEILAEMSAASPSPIKHTKPHSRPYFPRQSSAPFLPDPEGEVSSPESDLTRRTRLSIANLSAMTKNAEIQRKSSVKRAEKESARAAREQFMPKRLSTKFECGHDNEDDERRPDAIIVAGTIDDDNPFLSRPKVSND